MSLRYKGKPDERGDVPFIPGIPASNLNDDDIKRLAARRKVQATDDEGETVLRSMTPHQLTKELVESGLYQEQSAPSPGPAERPAPERREGGDS